MIIEINRADRVRLVIAPQGTKMIPESLGDV